MKNNFIIEFWNLLTSTLLLLDYDIENSISFKKIDLTLIWPWRRPSKIKLIRSVNRFFYTLQLLSETFLSKTSSRVNPRFWIFLNTLYIYSHVIIYRPIITNERSECAQRRKCKIVHFLENDLSDFVNLLYNIICIYSIFLHTYIYIYIYIIIIILLHTRRNISAILYMFCSHDRTVIIWKFHHH